MFRTIAGLCLASAASIAAAATIPTSTLDSTAPWWERVTVTISGDGEAHSCRFESSLKPNGAESCDVSSSPGATSKLSNSGSKAEFTRITFERRFTPGAQGEPRVPVGDTLLGQQVMALAIVWSYFHRLYEPGSTLARNFILIAPNLIVFERLRSDFGSGSIFLKDPLIPPEWRADFDLQVVLQDEASPPSSTGPARSRQPRWRPCADAPPVSWTGWMPSTPPRPTAASPSTPPCGT